MMCSSCFGHNLTSAFPDRLSIILPPDSEVKPLADANAILRRLQIPLESSFSRPGHLGFQLHKSSNCIFWKERQNVALPAGRPQSYFIKSIYEVTFKRPSTLVSQQNSKIFHRSVDLPSYYSSLPNNLTGYYNRTGQHNLNNS